MFGKRKSSNDSFVMAAGRAVGNLARAQGKKPTAQPAKKGDPVKKTAPLARVASPRQKIGSAGALRRELG